MSEQNSSAEDYAIAKHLNERAVAIFALVADYHNDLPDLVAINRSYVLLVHELKKLYDRNSELSSIRDNICWRTFETIDAIDPYKLWEYSDDYRNHGNDHISKVNSLCIVAGKESPDLSPELEKILEEANVNVTAFISALDKMKPDVRDWYIPEYALSYDEIRGAIKINGVYQLNKRSTNDDSNVDRLLKQALAKPNQLFVPDLSQTKKNLSTILSNAGFDPTLKKLFFTTAREDRGIFCRPLVSRAEADAEGIDTTELDLKLKERGATTKPVSPL